MPDTEVRDRITEDWLRSVGFKWHQLERQSDKQWLLWLGGALTDPNQKPALFSGSDDLGIELAFNQAFDDWFCWLRSDTAGRYHRFLHIRHLRYQDDLVRMMEALTGQAWDPANNWYGAMTTPDRARRLSLEDGRLDKQLLRAGHPWSETEKDPDRGGALPEHMEAAIKSGLAQ